MENRKIFYVLKKPDEYFPNERDSVFMMPKDIRRYEYMGKDGHMWGIIPEEMPECFIQLTEEQWKKIYECWDEMDCIPNISSSEITAEEITGSDIIAEEPRTNPVNFESIRKDYQEHGYLEDWQVEWLIDECANLLMILHFLTDIAEQHNISARDNMDITISRNLYTELKNKLKKEHNGYTNT